MSTPTRIVICFLSCLAYGFLLALHLRKIVFFLHLVPSSICTSCADVGRRTSVLNIMRMAVRRRLAVAVASTDKHVVACPTFFSSIKRSMASS